MESLSNYFMTARKKAKFFAVLFRFPRLAWVFMRWVLHPLAFKKETRFNKGFRYGFLVAGGGMLSPSELKAIRYNYEAKTRTVDRLKVAVEKNEPVVWTEWSVTREIINVFSVASYCPDAIVRVGFATSPEAGMRYLEAGENVTGPTELCGCHKAAIGAYLLKELPKPSLIVAATHPCDSGVSAYQILQNLTKAPMFVLDTPYWRDEASLTYYVKHLKALIRFCEENLGRTFEWDKFYERMKSYNEFLEITAELSDMGKARPCPYWNMLLVLAWELRMSNPGEEEPLKMVQLLYKNSLSRVRSRKGIVRKEKVRTLWWDVPFAFTDISSWMAKEFGAVVLCDYTTRFLHSPIDVSSEESMLKGLALAHLYFGMRRQCHGPVDYIVGELESLIDDYSPDCFVFSRHVGCKHNYAIEKIIHETCMKTGLPMLFLQTDIHDPRECSEAQIKREIADFFKENGLVK